MILLSPWKPMSFPSWTIGDIVTSAMSVPPSFRRSSTVTGGTSLPFMREIIASTPVSFVGLSVRYWMMGFPSISAGRYPHEVVMAPFI